ncbi:MAG: 50S ribosomal protein L29 [Candidatus Woesearchaeota archaeon]
MKASVLRAKSDQELTKMLTDLQLQLTKDYVQIAAGSAPKNPGNVRKTKRTIARIRTVLHALQSEQVKDQ